MTTVYISSTLMWSRSLEEIFDWTYKSGLDGIELWAQHFFCRNYSREEFCKLSALYPLRSCLHSASWDLNLASLNEGIREQSVKEVKRSIDLAADLGIREVTVHPGRKTIVADLADYAGLLRKSLRDILEHGERRQVDVSLEIMEKIPREFVTTMETMEQVCGEMFPRFCFTLDVAHCDSEGEALDTLREHGSRISKIHISNRRGNMYHTPLNQGDYDMGRLIPKLAEYGMPLVIEGLDPGEDFSAAKENVAYLKTII